jgi:hypothetical protein
MAWRKIVILFIPVMALAGLSVFFMALLYSNYFGHMKNDEAVNTFQISMPAMSAGTIPTSGGIEVLRRSDPGTLRNPLPASREVLKEGRNSYLYYCVQCHGPRFNGKATVGQSFYPLPADLLSPPVQGQSDGELYYKISVGYKRQPSLYATMTERERWAVIRYLRALARGKGEGRG